MAINSFQTNLRRKQKQIWGVRLLTSSLLETAEEGDVETVNIKDYLPQRVISDMSRKDGTIFKVLRYGSDVLVNDQVRLSSKMDDLVYWAKERKMDRSSVEMAMTKTLDKSYGEDASDMDDNEMGTLDNPSVATVLEEVSSIPQKQMVEKPCDHSTIVGN